MNLTTWITDLKAIIRTVWPDVAVASTPGAVHGIHEAEELGAIPFEELDPPYCLIVLPEGYNTHQGAMDVRELECLVYVYYVRGPEQSQTDLRTKLSALYDYLDNPNNEPASFQVMELDGIHMHRGMDVNVSLMSRNLPSRAGSVNFTIRI